jgi:peptidoglycan/LPS O-acetylase OafA/YrhL
LAVVVSHVTRADIGRLAVMLFFYLSGFWVSRIYQSEFQGRRLPVFYASRWLRIAPLYLIVLAATAIVRGSPIHPENVFLLGVDTTRRDPISVTWSLDIELQFYLLLPLFLGLGRKFLLPASIALSALGWWLHARFGLGSVLTYLPAFALGMLNEATRWAPGRRVAMVSLAGFLALTALTAAVPYTAPLLSKGVPKPFDRDLFAMVWMLPLVPYVAQSLTRKSSALDRDLGNWSYPLYLVHVPLISVFADHHVPRRFAFLALAVLTLALFYGPDRYFERLRRRLVNGPHSQKKAAYA